MCIAAAVWYGLITPAMAHTDENYHVFGQHADDAIVLFPRVVRYHDDRCCWQRDRRRRCSCSRSEWPTSCTSRGGGRWSPSCCDANRRCWPGSSIPAFCVSSTRSRRVSKYNSKHFLCFFLFAFRRSVRRARDVITPWPVRPQSSSGLPGTSAGWPKK